jgi:hypothetical protein
VSTQDIEAAFASSISRRWDQYMVKAVFAAERPAVGSIPPQRTSAEVRPDKEFIKRDFETQFFVLPTPIVIGTDDIKRVLEVRTGDKNVRIYPPFPLNEQAERSAALSEITFPEGKIEVDRGRRYLITR